MEPKNYHLQVKAEVLDNLTILKPTVGWCEPFLVYHINLRCDVCCLLRECVPLCDDDDDLSPHGVFNLELKCPQCEKMGYVRILRMATTESLMLGKDSHLNVLSIETYGVTTEGDVEFDFEWSATAVDGDSQIKVPDFKLDAGNAFIRTLRHGYKGWCWGYQFDLGDSTSHEPGIDVCIKLTTAWVPY